MRTPPFVAPFLLAVSVAAMTAPVAAATAPGPAAAALSAADAAAIRRAADVGDLPALYKALFSAVAAAPDRLDAIVTEAAALAPGYQGAIARTIDSAFPGRLPSASPAEPAASDAASAETAASDAAAETAEPASPQAPSPWSGEIAASASTSTGNSPLDSIGFATTVVYTDGPWQHEGSLSYDLSRNSDTTSLNRLELEYLPKYYFTDRVFGLGLGQFVRDRNEDFQFTAIEAVGPGYDVVKSDDVALSVAAGPGMRQERERRNDGSRLRNEAVGVATTDFAWNITGRLQFANDITIVGNPSATWIDTTSAITVKIDEHFSGRLSYSVRYNTDPPGDDNTTDTMTRAAIVYGFGQ